ncbi:MAG: alpha-amylase family glycosyl hydrolase [Bacteroidota bacterium]
MPRFLLLGLLTLGLALPALAQPALDVTFRYVPDPDDDFERVFLPGEFNGWGPNTNGRLATDAPALMTFVDSLGSYVYTETLTTGRTYEYKVHFQFNVSGSEWVWISDPLNPVVNSADNDNSVVAVDDLMVFQLARHESEDGQVEALSAGVFARTAVTALTVEVNGVAQDGLPFYNADSGIFYYALETPIPLGSQFKLTATTANDTAEAEVGIIPPSVVDAPRPPGVLDGVTYDDADPTRVTLSLFAPEKQFVHVIGDFNDWTVGDDGLLNRDAITSDSVHWWITLEGLTPGEPYGFQYVVDGELRIADFYSELILDAGNDRFLTSNLYPALPPYPDGQTTGPVGVFETGQQPFPFSDFERPPQQELVVYELLVRDFLEESRLGERSFYQALTDTLDYLDRLGVNAIELMPVKEFSGNDSWGYNPVFYFAPDKYYGPAEDLKAFIEAAHQRGLAVILDVVYNHIENASPLVQLFGLNDDNRWLNVPAKHPFNVFNDLNHEDPYTRHWLDRVNRYWLEEFNVDGYRFDLTKGFTQTDYGNDVAAWSGYDAGRVATLRRMAREIWAVDSTAYVILEHLGTFTEERDLITTGVSEGLPGMMVWNKQTDPYNEATMGYHESGKSNFRGTYFGEGGRGFPLANVISYMESHDEQWLMYKNIAFGNSSGDYDITELPVALDRQKLAGAFFFTVPGPRMIWQFGELGYGYGDRGEQCLNDAPFCPSFAPGRTGRKPIRWDYREDPLRFKLYQTWAALLNLRAEHAVFGDPDTEVEMIGFNGAVKTLRLTHPDLQAYIVGNFGVTTTDVAPNFQSEGLWYEFFTGETRDSAQDDTILLLPGAFRLYTNADVGTAEPGLITVSNEPAVETPTAFVLDQNYPNPFNPTTQIGYTLAEAGPVRLTVYDALGRQVAVLAEGVQSAGTHRVTFDARALPSGVYLYRLTTGTATLHRRMTLLR